MSVLFVPVVVPPQVPSRQARELSELLSRAISEYEHTHGSLTPGDIQQALDLAGQRNAGSLAGRRMVAVALGLVLALGVGVMAFAESSGTDFAAVLPWLEVGVVVALLVVVFAIVLRRRP